MDDAGWKKLYQELEKETKKYHVLSISTRAVEVEEGNPKKTVTKQGVQQVACAGLRVSLAELLEGIAKAGIVPPAGMVSLTIYADTLVLDPGSDLPLEINARSVVVVARKIEATGLEDKSIPVHAPAKKETTHVVEILAGTIAGGKLQLAPKTEGKTNLAPWTPVVGLPVQTSFCEISSDGKINSYAKRDPVFLADVVERPLALNAFKAAVAAATYLGRSEEAEQVQLAREMLAWVETLMRSSRAGGAESNVLFEELADQASALVVTLRTAGEAYFVPALSSELYLQQGDQLLRALESYEGHLRSLDVTTDIGKVVETVSGGLNNVAELEMKPLKTELGLVLSNMKVLDESINELTAKYIDQHEKCTQLYDDLDAALSDAQMKKVLGACFRLALEGGVLLYRIGRVIGSRNPLPDPNRDPVVQDVLDQLEKERRDTDALNNLKQYGLQLLDVVGEFGGIFAGTGISSQMLDAAHELLLAQQAVLANVHRGSRIWAKSLWSDVEVPEFPEELNANRIDPCLAWDKFLREAKTTLLGVPAEKAASKYLDGLTTLADYGKAVNAKTIVYCEQIARGTVLKSQIAATTNIAAEWKAIAQKAGSEQEKLGVLKGVVQLRIDSIRQSIYVAWTYYRNSYFYLNFQRPPFTADVNLSAEQLRGGFLGVSRWVARVVGEDATSRPITMPSSNVKISFEFPVAMDGDSPVEGARVARLTPATKTSGAKLNWTIPLGDRDLNDVLPRNGDVAVWITEAKLFLDGVAPNNRNNVLVRLSTSGYYQNGFGVENAYRFVTKPLTASYCYTVPNTVYAPWTINTAVYQMPTPFTQWTAEFEKNGGDPSNATVLRMELTVAFRGKE